MNKLVIDGRMINASGIGTYIKNIIPFLFSDFDISIIADNQNTEIQKLSGNVRIIPVKAGAVYSIKEQVKISFKIPKCNVYWSPHYNAPLFIKHADYKVLTVHDVFHLAYYNELSFLQKKYVDFFIKPTLQKYDQIVTVSEFSKNEILKYLNVDRKKITVIHNGINYDFFNEKKESDNVNNIGRYILFVGNIKPHKNIIGLLYAFYNICNYSTFSDLKIIIVGKKEGFVTGIKDIDKLIDKLDLKNKVIFAGIVTDEELRDYYHGAELLVFPSFYEGFGLPPLEAMACETPTVVSDRASMPEVCGDASLYFNPDDIDDMKNKIIKVLDNKTLKSELIKKGINRAAAYRWEYVAKKYNKFFYNLMS